MKLTKAQIQAYDMEKTIGGSVGNTCGIMLVNEPREAEVLKKAVNILYEKNDTLRTKLFVKNGIVSQCVQPYAPIEVEVLTFENKEQVHEYSNAFARVPLDINNELVEIKGFHSKDFCGLLFKLHHIISDGWTASVLSTQFYKFLQGEDFKAYSYSEYVESEKKYLESNRHANDIEYFTSLFKEKGEIVLFDETETISKEAKRKTYILDKKIADRIKEFANEYGLSPYSVFLTAISLVYSRLKNNAENFYIGTIVLNRTNIAERNTVGMFVNTVPFLVDLKYDESFVQNADKTTEDVFSIFRHQKCNYVDVLNEFRDAKATNKWFDITFSFQASAIKGENFESEWYCNGMQAETLQIHVDDYDCNGVFRLHYDYQIEKFTETDIEKLHCQLMTLLFDGIENPNKNISNLEMISPAEKQKVLNSFNDTAYTYDIPESATLYTLFEKKSEENREKVCIKANDKEITYKDFKAYVERIDNNVRAITKGEKAVIGVICERSFEMYGAVYGIIRGGNAYLPIDPNYPQDRIEYILENSNAKAVITQSKFCHLSGNTPCIDATEILNSTEQSTKTECLATPEDTAYVIYTSGSTGNPKGAKISHKSAINRILWMHDFYPLEENDVILQKTPYTFDVSVWELFWWGITGRTLCASKPDEHFLPAKILEETEKNKVTHIHFVPSVFDLFLTYLENNPEEQSKFKTVKYVFLSGEALTANHIKRFYNIYDYNKVQMHNLYGPTECAVDVSYYDCVPTDVDPVPIGKPIYNTQLHIVDKHIKPMPIGVIGELCIGGVNVGQGYLNNEQLTNEKFIDNPFGEGKLYRTGDLAYWREDGNICYVGRNDFQVKINGQRIELGEIENAIAEIDGVVQCAAIVRKDNENRQYICAFYTGTEIEVKEFRSLLGAKLPKYMIPHMFTRIEEMPLTSSGKISRNSLPQIELNDISTETEYVAPNTQEEKVLSDVLCSVLRTNSVNMLDNFFNIGGDSITAIYIVSELEEMGYELHVADIMQADTLLDVAKAMKSTSNKAIYEQDEVNGVIPFSPIMRAYLNENKEIPKDFVHTCIVSADCDENTVRKTLDVLVSHHDILRGTFVDNGIKVYPSNEREVYSFKAITIDDTDKAKEYLNNLKIDNDKLVNVVFCKTEKENLVSITIHHFLIDLVSWDVLMKDFQTIVKQLKNNEEISLPAKTASFKMWSDELRKYSEIISEENKEYWKNINDQLDNTRSLHSYEENENEAEAYSFTLDNDISDKLINEANKTYGTRTNEILLTALGLAAAKIANGSVGIIVESHGRTELRHPIAIERTIGWFTSCYPIVINNNNKATDELIKTKETMRRIPKNGIDYLLLSPSFHKNADIIFNYYSNITNENKENKLIAFNGSASVFPGKINVNCSIVDNILTVNISIPKCEHKLKVSEKLGGEFLKQIEKIIDICTTTDTVIKTRSDFSDYELTESDLDELKELFEWTDDDE